MTLTASLLMLNASFLELTSSTDEYQMMFASAYLHNDVTHILWLIVPPVLLVLGSYGNVMTIVVMRAMRASESTGCLSVYFTALAVSDLFVLWTNVVWFWPEMAMNFPLTYFHDLSCTVPFFISYVSSMTSAWILVAMTCQRMTSVVLPQRVEVLCTIGTGKIITAAILFLSCAANIYILLFFHIEYLEQGYPSCTSSDTNAANIFGFLYTALGSLIPFLLLIVANSVLIFGAQQSMKMSGKMAGPAETHISTRSAKVFSITTTLILTSLAFLLLTLPNCVLWFFFVTTGYFDGEIEDEAVNKQLALADTVCLMLVMTNSSVNFYIYILSGRKFRKEAKRYLCLCLQNL